MLVTAGQQANRPTGQQLALAGAVAMLVPITNVISNRPKIAILREPGEGPGVRALYSHLPQRSALVAENYWLARLINYMHYSNEYSPDPNPRVLDSDAGDVKTAIADGLQVYAFEGAAQWLTSQGFVFERTNAARQPFESWFAQQPKGTLIVAASSGRALPFEWLPPASRAQSGRPSNFGAIVWSIGDAEAAVDQNDTGIIEQRVVGAEGRALTITSNDDGPRVLWGDDVITAIDRGLVMVAFSPDGRLIGQWAFAVDETPGVQLPPTPFMLRGEKTCQVLRPSERTDVSAILADGSWWATVEGTGKTPITIETEAPPATWRHRVSNGRGEATIEGSRLMLDPTRGTRSVFRFTMPPAPARAFATLEGGAGTAVRVCPSAIPALPATGAFEVGPDHDGWFGAGWHLGERGGTQRFRWSPRASSLMWRMERPAPIRMLLRVRPANAKGATLQASMNGLSLSSCTLPAGAWTECRLEIPEAASRSGINQLTLTADTVSPSADRPGDARELSFVMQASRVRAGQ
jgi:hypothetical protein